MRLRETVNEINEMYAIDLMFDISGSFDGVWWPSVLHNLKIRSCPRNIYCLMKSYLSDRMASITSNSTQVSKIVNKVCPQSSVLGPSLWNLILDDIIEKISETG